MEVSQLLNKAADILERRHLCKYTGGAFYEDDPLCMNSALAKAENPNAHYTYVTPLLYAARQAIIKAFGRDTQDDDTSEFGIMNAICYINNLDETTTESAVALMRKAAKEHAEVSHTN